MFLNNNNQKYLNILNFSKNKIYHLHNSYHLGDNLFNFIFFYIIKDYLEKNNIKIYYYVLDEHFKQVSEFSCSHNIKLLHIKFKPIDSIELWGDEPIFKVTNDNKNNLYSMNESLKLFYNRVLKIFNMNFTINKFYYIDDNLIKRYENIDNKYKNFDILIVNSIPRSGQYNYNKNEWDSYIINLNKIFNILTTTKVHSILCTTDNNLTVKDIASLSTKAKVIIAINSGVVPALLNYYTLTNVLHFYTFDKYKYFTYPNFHHKSKINDITIHELKKYVSPK